MNIGKINPSASISATTGNKMTSKAELRSNSLQSWKEIAAYLKRAVRTAQRWERSAGLPVRRPRISERNSVFAFPEEIDQWLRSRPDRR